MAKITGRIEVLLDGKLLLNKAGAKATGIGISGEPGYERKVVIGDTGPHGYVETPVMAGCEVTITDRDDISLSSLARVKGDGTITFRAAGGGKVYIMEGATAITPFTITGGEGETEVKFEGPYWTESTQ